MSERTYGGLTAAELRALIPKDGDGWKGTATFDRAVRLALSDLLTAVEAREVKEWDGRSVGESSPHAAYCDIALQDAQVQNSDKGELIWSYSDELFDKSLAANGYKIVPIAAVEKGGSR